MNDLIKRYTEQLGREVYLRPGTSDEGGWSEAFEHEYHVPPPEMPIPRTVLDLGANIGLAAAHYRALWPEAKVVADEPDPDNLAVLRKNTDAFVRQLAINTRFGFARFVRAGLSADAGHLDEDGELRVYCVTLEHAIRQDFGQTVDFVKMDVEGTEWELFAEPEWAPRVRHLLVECHGEPRDYPRILARGIAALEEIGFEARHHPPHPAAVWAVQR